MGISWHKRLIWKGKAFPSVAHRCHLPLRLGAPPLKPHKTSAAPNVLAQIGIAESQGILQKNIEKQKYTLLLY